MTRRSTTFGAAAAAAGGAALAAGLGLRFGAPYLIRRTERRLGRIGAAPPYRVSDPARALHDRLVVVDLHADSLLWGRDLRLRADIGHVDVPRMIEGGLAVEGFAVSTKVPHGTNLERNGDWTDLVLLVALAQRWPRPTWLSLLARALYHAERLRAMADASEGRLTLIADRPALVDYLERRRTDPRIAAGFLAIEGAHALDGDPANLERVADAGYTMLSMTHFFDNAFGGSAHGIDKGGLTSKGRELLARMEARSVLVDLAHASAATIDDVLTIAARPVVASHSGVRAGHDSIRNLPDAQVHGIAASGGLVGIGFWPEATGGADVGAIVRAITAAVALVGVEHVALGSDFDGAVPVPFDVTGLPLLTEALIADGYSEASIAAIMGGNAVRLLLETLPDPGARRELDQSSGAMREAALAAPSDSTGR